jgi:uncharacterized membrane protein YgcG
MCSTRVKEFRRMKSAVRTGLLAAALAGVGAMVAGCANEAQLRNDMGFNDFGRSVHEDLAAQIADPDASYKGPPPPSSGRRADLAQTKYKTNTVKQPQSTSTGSSGGSSGGGGSGGGGGGGGGSSSGGGNP